jgi:hypothetical protein
MVPSETATGATAYVTLSFFVTASTPGTVLTSFPTSSLSSTLPTLPCSVTTNEQELTLILDVSLPFLPSAPRTNWASNASLAEERVSRIPSARYPSFCNLGTRVSLL